MPHTMFIASSTKEWTLREAVENCFSNGSPFSRPHPNPSTTTNHHNMPSSSHGSLPLFILSNSTSTDQFVAPLQQPTLSSGIQMGSSSPLQQLTSAPHRSTFSKPQLFIRVFSLLSKTTSTTFSLRATILWSSTQSEAFGHSLDRSPTLYATYATF